MGNFIRQFFGCGLLILWAANTYAFDFGFDGKCAWVSGNAPNGVTLQTGTSQTEATTIGGKIGVKVSVPCQVDAKDWLASAPVSCGAVTLQADHMRNLQCQMTKNALQSRVVAGKETCKEIPETRTFTKQVSYQHRLRQCGPDGCRNFSEPRTKTETYTETFHHTECTTSPSTKEWTGGLTCTCTYVRGG